MADKKKKVIVTTTINPPTKAIQLYDAMKDWHLVVLGDRKTPRDYRLENGTYLSPEAQEKIDPVLSDLIGWNCIQRRNFGLIWAYRQGAEVVATIDDDNIPLENWESSCKVGKKIRALEHETPLPAFDPLFVTNYPHLWHRGFPVQWLKDRKITATREVEIVPDVHAGLWNGDPDIDAICRMEHRPEVTFQGNELPFCSNRMAPFNSQNTFLSAACLKDYFLFPGIGRMDDIWGAYWLQAKGYKAVFGDASVFQERNPHDLTIDFQHETIGHMNNHKLIESLAKNPDSIFEFLPEKSRKIYELYSKHFHG